MNEGRVTNSKSHQLRTSTTAPRKTGQLKDNKKQPAETKPKSAMDKFKSMMKLGSLFSSGSKTTGQPPAVHPPWTKARVGPMEEGKAGRERAERGSENQASGQAGEEAAEQRMGRESKRMPNNGMRNGFGGGIGPPPEQRRTELPGLPSSSWSGSVSNGIVIDGTYFQTASDANQVAPAKQKLSEALSLISLSRRLQGAAIAMDWENHQETNTSVGDRSVAMSGGLSEEQGQLSGGLTEKWVGKKKRKEESKESPSELSDTSSPSSSIAEAGNSKDAENDSTSKTETEESDTEKEPNTTEDSASDDGESSEDRSDSERGKSKSAKSRPKTSRRRSRSTDGESEEESEESDGEEAESPRDHDDLSPIMEDSEEEGSSGQDAD